MKYPTILDEPCRDLVQQLLDGDQPSPDLHTKWIGEGDEVSLNEIEELAREHISNLPDSATDAEKEQLEADVAMLVYTALKDAEVEVLDDPGFWRYLSLSYFWEFIRWREAKAFARGNYLRYVDGRSSTDCVLTRMYLRGLAVGGETYAEYTSGLSRSTDFWRSHVLRVRTGTAPNVVRAFVDLQQRHRLATSPLRDFAKSLNRIWTNVVLMVYSEDKAEDLMKRIRRQLNLDVNAK